MKLRSPLFAPGDSERKIAKALSIPADAIILDLEDSVAPSAKPGARDLVAATLRQASRDLVVRVNPRGTEWHLADLAAVIPARPAALMLPKCEGAHDLRALDHALSVLETAAGLPVGGIGVIALATETAASVLNLASYPGAPRLLALAFGAEDLSADLGIAPRLEDGRYPAPVAAARAQMLIAAAAAGVPALDTPYPDPRAPGALARESAAAAADGFAGKLCIHPDQITPVNDAFTPSGERIAWARMVRDAFAANPGAGVISWNGKMLDRPHLKLAERILTAIEAG